MGSTTSPDSFRDADDEYRDIVIFDVTQGPQALTADWPWNGRGSATSEQWRTPPVSARPPGCLRSPGIAVSPKRIEIAARVTRSEGPSAAHRCTHFAASRIRRAPRRFATELWTLPRVARRARRSLHRKTLRWGTRTELGLRHVEAQPGPTYHPRAMLPAAPELGLNVAKSQFSPDRKSTRLNSSHA